MQRVMVYDNEDRFLFELSPQEVLRLTLNETINGEHSLTIDTTHVLGSGNRILTKDNRGIWREHVVYGTDQTHKAGVTINGIYHCVWSLQHDLMGTTVSKMPGVQTPVTAGLALQDAISGTSRWVAGTVTRTSSGGASMYDCSGWEALSTLVDVWGGEVGATINVSNSGIISRKVDLYEHQGEAKPLRRFDFGADLKSIRRKVEDGPVYCRISPRGKGEAKDSGGYGRKITIKPVNGQIDWLQNDAMVPYARVKTATGYEYPTLIVENSDCETPSQLKQWGLSVLEEYTTPKVVYEVDVVQAASEGVDLKGVSLGDEVHVVDKNFGGDGLRLSARVMSVETDMLEDSKIKLVIGNAKEGIADIFGKIRNDFNRASARISEVLAEQEYMATSQYLSELLDRLNTEINADGGYTYITDGQGIRTYDKKVSDPLVGSEASKVVEIKGGSIRIANSKTAQGAWEWKTVFVSGHIAAELVTAAQITTGYIGNSSGSNYWNLDNNYLTVGRGEINADVLSGGTIKLGGSNNGNGVLRIYDSAGTQIGYITNSGSNLSGVFVNRLNDDWIRIDESYVKSGHGSITDGHIDLSARYGSADYRVTLKAYRGSIQLQPSNYVQVEGSFYVNGSKNRIVKTDNYSKRLLYSYETASPYFGDLGSGIIGDDGVCIVSIDDIFSETASTNTVYHVFLQSLGGDVYVSEKRKECFVVIGEPGTEFEWEIKARQLDYEPMRLEPGEIFLSAPFVDDYENLYHDYVSEIEALYEEGEEYETVV